MKKLSRREVMGTIITAGAGVTLAGKTGAAAQTPAAPAFSGQHQIKPLPFDRRFTSAQKAAAALKA